MPRPKCSMECLDGLVGWFAAGQGESVSECLCVFNISPGT